MTTAVAGAQQRVTTRSLRGVYAVTPSGWNPATLEAACATVLDAGVAALQYRDKPRPNPDLAQRLASLCADHGIPLLINDDVALAAALGVGVHVGRHDAAVADARARLGADALVGASVYNDLDAALAAQQDGADYVSFGRFFASRTKPDATPARPAILTAAAARLTVPVAAIGGITHANAATVIDAGADLIAVVDAVFGHTDLRRAVTDLNAVFESSANPRAEPNASP